MKSLLGFELQKNFKTILILSLVSGLMVLFSMMFYKTISENLNTLSAFLSTGFMKGILTAFNVDVFSMRTLNGFFASYCTMWVVLMGSVFFSYFGSELLAKEEKMGTIEFLLSKPIRRKHIFISKLMTLFIACTLFMVIVGILGYSTIYFQIKYAPYELNMDVYDETIADLIKESSDSMKPFVNFNEDDFKAFTMGMLMKQYTENKAEIAAAGIDADHIMSVLKNDLDDPEALFEKMIISPKAYMKLLQVNDISEEVFVKALVEERAQYKGLKKMFLEHDVPFSTLFVYDPAYFIQYWIDHKQIEEVDFLLNNELTHSHLVTQFDVKVFMRLLLSMFIIVLANGILGFSIAAITIDAQTSSQKAMILVLILYFVNSIGGISEITSTLKYFTTFGYIELDMNTYQSIHYKPLFLLIFLIALIGYAYKKYQKRNFN